MDVTSTPRSGGRGEESLLISPCEIAVPAQHPITTTSPQPLPAGPLSPPPTTHLPPLQPPPPPSHSLAIVPFTGTFPFSPFPPRAPSSNGLASSSDAACCPPPAPAKKPALDREHKKRSKNWTRNETLALIRLRASLAPRFAQAGRKTELWDEISLALCRSSFSRDAQQCRDKWEKLMAGYKEVRDGIRPSHDYPYFDELHPLLSSRPLKRDREREPAGERLPSSSPSTTKEPSPVHSMRREDVLTGSPDAKIHTEEDDAEMCVARKKRKGPEIGELRSVEALVEAVIARQQRFFSGLLDAIEQKEQLREQIRQEREDKWRAEDRAQRGMFTEAMLLLTQKLGGERRAVPPSVASTLVSIPASPLSPPPPAPLRPPPATPARAPAPAPAPPPPSAPPPLADPPPLINHTETLGLCINHTENLGPKPRSKNWKRAEVLQLIKLRGDMEGRFLLSARKTPLWEELADALRSQGISRDAKQCREKWEKLTAEYKDVTEGKKKKTDSPYFSEMTAAMPRRSPA